MNLLLFISALLTGLTGAFSGAQRADAPAMHQSVAQAFEVVAKSEAQPTSSASQNESALRRPVHANAKLLGWVLKFQSLTTDLARIYERMLI